MQSLRAIGGIVSRYGGMSLSAVRHCSVGREDVKHGAVLGKNCSVATPCIQYIDLPCSAQVLCAKRNRRRGILSKLFRLNYSRQAISTAPSK